MTTVMIFDKMNNNSFNSFTVSVMRLAAETIKKYFAFVEIANS